MIIRRAVDSDLARIVACRAASQVSHVDEQTYRRNLEARSYRFEWTWIAEEDGRILARAVWWGLPPTEHAVDLDCLHVDPAVPDPVELGGRLVAEAVGSLPGQEHRPTYHLFLPTDWHDDAGLRGAVGWRLEAVARAGLTQVLERWRYEWTAALAPPPRADRLRFVPAADDAFVDAFRRVAVGTLDAGTRGQVAHLGPEKAAREELALYASMPGPRDDWRLALDGGGDVVGFAIPSANEGGPVIGYLGVVPERRGRGYVDDLLGEATAILIERGASRIVGEADAENAPMVAAFRRAGFRHSAVRLAVSERDPADESPPSPPPPR